MYSAVVWGLPIIVVAVCATAGGLFPWPLPGGCWRVCGLIGIGYAARVLTGFGRRGAVGPPGNRVVLALAIGCPVRGATTLLVDLTAALVSGGADGGSGWTHTALQGGVPGSRDTA